MMPSATSHRRPSSISTSTRPPSSHSRRSSNPSRRSSRLLNGDDVSAPHTPLSVQDFAASIGAGAGVGALDTLADELAEAWDDDDDGCDSDDGGGQFDGSPIPLHLDASSSPSSHTRSDSARIRDSGVQISPTSSPSRRRKSSISKKPFTHGRALSHYNSDAASSAALPQDDFPKSLLRTMKDVENMASMADGQPSAIPEETASEPHDTTVQSTSPISHLTNTLQNLGSQQSGLEMSVTRLVTAHTSLTAHIAHETRSLSSTTYFFLSPLPSQPLFGSEQIDSILPALNETIASLPQPTIDALASIDRLAASSKDAISALASLSDNIHVTRQTAGDAARKMTVTKDMVSELRREYQQADDARDWLQRGGWEEASGRRSCKAECDDIVTGFDEVCESWRRRLFESGRVAAV